MATVSSTGNSAADAATQQLQQIQRDLNRLQAQQAQKDSGNNVQEFEKDTRDVKIESSATARNIGVLQKNKTRLNVFSSLSSGDSVDGFQFRVTDKTATTFAILNATQDDKDKLHFQIYYKSTGRILADSDPKAGDANTVFNALQDGTFEMEKGDYILRVSRTDNTGANRNTEYNYAVQLTQGVYSQDYDTVERAARDTDDPYGIGNVSEATTNLTSSIASSVSFIQSLPKIGTSATDKLMGLIINSVS
jgi:TolA-binding protein